MTSTVGGEILFREAAVHVNVKFFYTLMAAVNGVPLFGRPSNVLEFWPVQEHRTRRCDIHDQRISPPFRTMIDSQNSRHRGDL